MELMVVDTGIGIPSEELPLLGKRFHRVQTSGGRSHEGTGIGILLLSRRLRGIILTSADFQCVRRAGVGVRVGPVARGHDRGLQPAWFGYWRLTTY